MQVNIFIGAVQFIVLLLSLSVHETAHAWTADRLGDPTARYLGRVSLNPLVHADLFGTIIFPLMGLYTGFMFGWAKPTPVNVNRLRHPARDHMLVAAAGPVSNFLIAIGLFTCLMVFKAVSTEGAVLVREVATFRIPAGGNSVMVPLTVVAFQGIVLNLILGIFNLLPIAPLDGAVVLQGLLPSSMASVLDQFQSYGFMILIALLFLGVPTAIYMPIVLFFTSYLTL